MKGNIKLIKRFEYEYKRILYFNQKFYVQYVGTYNS